MSDGILSSGHIVIAPRSRAAFIGSYAAQVLAALVLAEFCVYAPAIEIPIKPHSDYHYIALAPPPTLRPALKPVIHAPEAVVQPINAHLAAPPPKRVVVAPLDPTPIPVKVAATALPEMLVKTSAVKPHAPVITGGFSSGSSATP